MIKCLVENCYNKVKVKNLCKNHYYSLRRKNSDIFSGKIKMCSIDECSNPVEANNICRKHYDRFKKYGKYTLSETTIPFVKSHHPLYNVWTYVKKSGCCQRWNDFTNFSTDVGNNPNNTNSEVVYRFGRKTKETPFGPENWEWKTKSLGYGLTAKDYKLLYENQNKVCCICKHPETAVSRNGKIKKLAIDHCHITGKVRGLLCFNCNTSLGFIKDDKNILERMIEYINYFGENK